MNDLTCKLLRDGSDKRQIQLNTMSDLLGFGLLFIGILCITVRALCNIDMDGRGDFDEKFFLLPIGAVFMFCGFITFVVTGVKNSITLFLSQSRRTRAECTHTSLICATVVLGCIGVVMLLVEANFGTCMLPICTGYLIAAVISGIAAAIRKKGMKKFNEK